MKELMNFIENNKCIIFMQGLPGSGKSTFIKRYFRNKYPVFSNDINRMNFTFLKTGINFDYNYSYKYSSKKNKEFQKYNYNLLKSTILNLNSSLIIDNTNTFKNSRNKIFTLIKNTDYKIVVIKFNPKKETLINNLLKRNKETNKFIDLKLLENFYKYYSDIKDYDYKIELTEENYYNQKEYQNYEDYA